MRASWSPKRFALLALIGSALLSNATQAWAQSRDTTRAAERVTISREGIRIDVAEGGDAKVIEIDGSGSSVTIEGDDEYGGGGHGRGEIVSFFRDIHVEPGKVVRGEVVALFGSVKIEGEVNGDVVAVMGSIELGDSARVRGDAVAIGGIDASPSAEVQGDMVSIPFLGLRGFSSWTIAVALLILTAFGVLCTWLASLILPERLVRVAETVSRRTLMSFLLGILSLPLVIILAILLCVTVIGIPMAMLLGALYPVFAFLGFVAAATLLGSRLRNAALDTRPVWVSALVGVIFNAIFVVVGGVLLAIADSSGAVHAVGMGLCAVGFLLHTLLSVLGAGALILSGLGSRPPAQAAEAASMGQVTHPVASA